MADDDKSFTIGSLTLRPAYGNDPEAVWIEQESGEGGNFPVVDVEAALQAFYKEHF